MALSDFLLNVRTAAMFLDPKVEFDSPQLDTEDSHQTLAKADIWLTPKAVEGFEEDDFSFLSQSQRATLKENVEAFREVANQVSGNEPATAEQVRRASGHFLVILKTLHPYLDRDWLRVYQALRSISFPPEVVGVTHEVRPDWTGDPAVWVWVTVEDQSISNNQKQRLEQSRRLKTLVEDALRSAHIDDLLYFGIWARSEMPEVIGAHAD